MLQQVRCCLARCAHVRVSARKRSGCVVLVSLIIVELAAWRGRYEFDLAFSVNTWWVHEYSSMLLHHMPWMIVLLHSLQVNATYRSSVLAPFPSLREHTYHSRYRSVYRVPAGIFFVRHVEGAASLTCCAPPSTCEYRVPQSTCWSNPRVRHFSTPGVPAVSFLGLSRCALR